MRAAPLSAEFLVAAVVAPLVPGLLADLHWPVAWANPRAPLHPPFHEVGPLLRYHLEEVAVALRLNEPLREGPPRLALLTLRPPLLRLPFLLAWRLRPGLHLQHLERPLNPVHRPLLP